MSDSALDTMTGLIPTVFVGGMLMKFSDWAFNPQRERRQRVIERKRVKKYRRMGYPAEMSQPNFRNVGF